MSMAYKQPAEFIDTGDEFEDFYNYVNFMSISINGQEHDGCTCDKCQLLMVNLIIEYRFDSQTALEAYDDTVRILRQNLVTRDYVSNNVK